MKTKKTTILVIDDHYAIDSSSATLSHYDKNCFLEDYSLDRFEFIFCSAFDAKQKEYNLFAVEEELKSLKNLPDMILLDIMFGDEEFLGVEILKFLAVSYPTITVTIMTSKQKSELFEKTLSLGAIDYLVKPLNREELHNTIFRYSGENKSFVIGQESSFLSIVNHVTLSQKNLLIETEDTRRAISLFEYSARVKDIGFNIIDMGNEQTVESVDIKIQPNALNLFLNLDKKAVIFQDNLYFLLKEYDKSTFFGAICSGKIIQDIKQHGFSQNLYQFLSSTNVRLEKLSIDSIDLLLLFRYYLNLLKPKKSSNSITLSQSLLSKIFSSNNNLTVEDILKLLESFLSSKIPLTNSNLLEYVEQNFIYESYPQLQEKLDNLRITEFEILVKALQNTTKSGKKTNKSLAISLLLDNPQASTNNYDRWIKKVWKEIPLPKQNEYRELGYLNSLGIRF